jgi:ABC-type transport system substrate-binding protein
MKDSRIGECLWAIWEGMGYEDQLPYSVVYYTEDHVDLDQEVVRKALASSIQRDGLVYSLAQGYGAIDAGIVSQKWVGLADGELYEEICDKDGLAFSDGALSNIVPVTFVEVPELV